MHQPPASKPPPSRFRRVTIVIQTVLVIALTGMLPIIGSIILYQTTNGAPFEQISQFSCTVDNGRVVLPFVTENIPQVARPQSEGVTCQARLLQKLYHGEHEINCYASPESKRPAGSPVEIASIFLLTLCSGAMLLLALPISIRLLRCTIVGEDAEIYSPWRDVRARRLLIALPALSLFLPSVFSVLRDDILSYWSRDWIPRECKLVEACTAEDAKNDRSGFVFELVDLGRVYRSDSHTGYFSTFVVPEEIKGTPIGAPIPCFQNPKSLAQLKIQPSHGPQWIDYATRTLLLGIWGFLVFYATGRYKKP